MTEKNKPYHLNILFSPLLEQNKVEEIIEKIKQKITAESGSFSGEKPLLRKRLAYPIKKHLEAFNYTFNFLLLPGMVNKIEKYLGSEKNVIRHLITMKKIPKIRPPKETIDLKMIDKIEPLDKIEPSKEAPILDQDPDQSVEEKAPSTSPESRPKHREKVKIEELDKKLKEILDQ